jgi:hypothetical protein
MIEKWWLALAGGLVCATAGATSQDTVEHDGTWNVRIEGGARIARQARVVISDFDGLWQELGPKRAGDPCRSSKPFPITVQESTAEEIEFTVWSEMVTKACPDFALVLKVVDERTLVGTLKAADERKAASTISNGLEVRLTRAPDRKKARR